MELLKLSKFKLQLQSLTSEVRELRERKRSTIEQLSVYNQRQKQTEEEYGTRLQELQAELALSNETCQKLERRVSYLQSDNALLERKQRELKETIQGLLQSREQFVNAYEESTRDMKRAIEGRDRKLKILSEKISSHISLFDSIENEASSVKQLVDSIQLHVSERENIVASLKTKLDKVSAFEELFFEKIHHLESKLKNYEEDFRRQNKVISELEAKLEAAKISDDSQYQIELQKTLLTKDTFIQTLISEKEAFHAEAGSLRIILQRIQETVTSMNEEDKRVFSSLVDQQEGSDINKAMDDNSTSRMVRNSKDNCPYEAYGKRDAEHTASPCCKKVRKELLEDNINSCAPESACSTPHSAVNDLSIPVKDKKDYCTASMHLVDSECSTTNPENSQPR